MIDDYARMWKRAAKWYRRKFNEEKAASAYLLRREVERRCATCAYRTERSCTAPLPECPQDEFGCTLWIRHGVRECRFCEYWRREDDDYGTCSARISEDQNVELTWQEAEYLLDTTPPNATCDKWTSHAHAGRE